ncbi:MAG: hypothetical protein AVDCRST_MAG59-2936, partial [uncultured Thermomicrobiales bacterium]
AGFRTDGPERAAVAARGCAPARRGRPRLLPRGLV